MRIIGFLILFFTLLSCSENLELKKALQLSGENRFELERVLRHFLENPEDSLKLKAAEFLIANMPGHYSVVDPYILEYYNKVDSLNASIPAYIKNVLYSLPQYYVDLTDAEKVEDVQIMESGFLINHINKMFHIWENVPWGKEVSFKTFCEYVLPYRLDNEPLPELMKNCYYFPIDSFSQQLKDYNVTIDEFLYNYVWRILPQSGREFNLPDPIVNNYIADCIWDSYKVLSEGKNTCVPVAIDFTPCWPLKNGKHFWNSIEDPCLLKKTFSENYIDHYAKVYRKTYSRNPFPQNKRKDFIPYIFQTPFNKDVTDLYCKTTDVKIHFDKIPQHKIDNAYLSVFNNGDWQPVAWSVVTSNKKAVFEKMGLNCVYLPICYKNREVEYIGYPFILNSKENVIQLIPDKQHLMALSLTRKYPISSMAYGLNIVLKNITIECSETFNFDQKKSFSIQKIENKPLQEIVIDSEFRKRYLKLSPNSSKGEIQIAEIYFYDNCNNRILGDLSKCIVKAEDVDFVNIVDNDPLTYSTIDSSIVFDCLSLPDISKIKILPRNDDNYIAPGELYELFYFDIEGWISLGKKLADDYFIEYENVPSKALYWIKNHTKGVEERIFTMEDNRQIFW